MPKFPCLEADCPEFAVPKGRGRCQDHASKRDKSINRSGRALYKTKRWQMARRRVLFEEPICRQCQGGGESALATEVDHINGDPTDNRRENLQPLCKAHHSAKTRREQNQRA